MASLSLKGQASSLAQKEEAVCLVWEERDNDAELHQPGTLTGTAYNLRDVCLLIGI